MIYVTRDIDSRGTVAFWKEKPTLDRTVWEGKGFFDIRNVKWLVKVIGPQCVPNDGQMLEFEDEYALTKKLGMPFQKYRNGEPLIPLPEPF